MTGPSDEDLAVLLRDERRRMAIDERRHRRGLDEQSTASGTIAGVLVDIAETGGSLTLASRPSTVRHGVIGRLGAEVVELLSPAGAGSWVVIGAIVWIRQVDGGPARRGDRLAPVAGSLAGLLADLALQRAEVAIDLVDGSTVRGTLASVGTDVATLRTADRGWTYVSMTAIAAVAAVAAAPAAGHLWTG